MTVNKYTTRNRNCAVCMAQAAAVWYLSEEAANLLCWVIVLK